MTPRSPTSAAWKPRCRPPRPRCNLSQINLDYTDIRSPIDGKIGRTAVTEGNVVSPGSGVLTTIVSQDPMYVTFPVSVREGLELRDRYATRGGFKAVVIRIRLPDGRIYDQTGQLNFVNNTIAQNTDTITAARHHPQSDRCMIRRPPAAPVRELTDGEFVTVMLEGVQPVEVLAIPRSAVLSDQQGEYVFTVGADNKAEQRRIQLGQSTSTIAAVINGLSLGDKVIVEGLQRVRPGQPVAPGPASALIQSSMKAAAEDGGTPTDSGSADRRRSRRATAHDFRRLRRSSPSCDRDRVRHHDRGRAGAAANSGGAVSRHRAAAGHGHRRCFPAPPPRWWRPASPSRSRRRWSASTRCCT